MKRGRGRPPHPDLLTPAEWEVLNAARHGMSNSLIARKRKTSLDATKFHIANILDKLDLPDRRAIRHWIGWPAESALNAKGSDSMSQDSQQLGPLGQVSLSITDTARSVAFYRDVLGLPHLFTFGNLAFFDLGGTRLFLTPPENGEPKRSSVLYFRVGDIHAKHQELMAKGVEFSSAPHLIHRHEDGMEEWMAFFNDPDGQILALMSQVKS